MCARVCWISKPRKAEPRNRSGICCKAHAAQLRSATPESRLRSLRSATPEPRTAAGTLDDLHAFDPRTLTWVDLSATAAGTRPERRAGPGLAAAGGRLYVHAGFSERGMFELLPVILLQL